MQRAVGRQRVAEEAALARAEGREPRRQLGLRVSPERHEALRRRFVGLFAGAFALGILAVGLWKWQGLYNRFFTESPSPTTKTPDE